MSSFKSPYGTVENSRYKIKKSKIKYKKSSSPLTDINPREGK